MEKLKTLLIANRGEVCQSKETPLKRKFPLSRVDDNALSLTSNCADKTHAIDRRSNSKDRKETWNQDHLDIYTGRRSLSPCFTSR